jgi:hypothetical protein
MPTKKSSKPSAKAAPAAASKPKLSPKRLENLAAKPASFDVDVIDEQLVDHSGVFRVTSAIQRDQIGHDDDNNPRFASDSLVMAAQRDGFREDPADDPLADEAALEDEATAAVKRQRLATLAALAAQKKKRR